VNFEENLWQWYDNPRTKKDLDRGWNPHTNTQMIIVQEMPVQSLVCNPAPNTVLSGKNLEEIEVKGVAWSGGGRGIVRVDVSLDGGKNFTVAELDDGGMNKVQMRNRHWSWYHFKKMMPLPDDVKEKLKYGYPVQLEITSKAVNGDYNVQPENPEPF